MRVAVKTAYTSLRIILIYECNANVVHFDGVQLFNTYGPWGESWGVSGTLASTLGAMNPLRYRGYVYDTETGLYYLNSRYYNPTWGRFINADGQLNDGIFGNNLFSYCLNNPVNMSDYEGNVPDWINKAAKWVKEKIIQPIKRIFSPNKKSNLPDNYMLYKEHQKKGTTNPSNRNTREKGQARKTGIIVAKKVTHEESLTPINEPLKNQLPNMELLIE